ncbi:protein P21-like isoform X2 [Ananas comosus]|uniref:Protein P21-like isoform X1 n=1 Tax=Ananas comosus TaxID=4615 RepID=A0A6P5FS66_ANACO|nr:protein P21-like isoform X1 [Ananas comosus]XP_020095916.1 protein P21-like isoform X2 [Ananas comosus]
MATQTTLPLLLLALVPLAAASTFNVVNRCSYTVWGAASPGGGAQLNPGQSWTFNVADGTTGGRVWARTGCSFDSNGNGHCQTGDCGGVLACTGYGQNPNTLAEYALNQSGGLDYFDISLVAGFNVPLSFKPTSNGCTSGPSCAADINASCPAALRVPGGCDDPCTIFGTPEYCCPSGSSCNPTGYSKFFKGQCPQAFSYPDDYAGTTFTCPGNTNYQVVFCPQITDTTISIAVSIHARMPTYCMRVE